MSSAVGIPFLQGGEDVNRRGLLFVVCYLLFVFSF